MKKSVWWRNAVFYQIYPRSFFDSNGDGDGDLPGITAHLGYVKKIGVDAIWLSPFYESPNNDGGYDVSDPRSVDPRHGDLDDAQKLIDHAHKLELKVLIDIIPNHFSSEHKWFQAALKSPKGSPERSRFHFYDSPDGLTPPNNWISLFGGPAWSQLPDGQWYLHLFDSSQPDLNWENVEVREDFETTLHFWLKMGVDGFRIDVAHGLVKENILTNHPNPQGLSSALRLDLEMDSQERAALLATTPFFDRDGVHEIYRRWRVIFDSYHRDVMAVAEAWVYPPERATLYVREDELQQVFNFDLLITPFNDRELYQCIDRTLTLLQEVNAPPTWALSNHDSPRLATRLGDENKARALALFLFGLPGACYIYQGQELGLPDAELADIDRRDPAFIRSHGAEKGRDGARVPIPWNGAKPPFGFTTGSPWLPMPDAWAPLSIENETGDSASSLEMYRAALTLRRKYFTGEEEFIWKITPDGSGLISFMHGKIEVLLNTSAQSQQFTTTGKSIFSSDQLPQGNPPNLLIGKNSALWILHT